MSEKTYTNCTVGGAVKVTVEDGRLIVYAWLIYSAYSQSERQQVSSRAVQVPS